MKYYRLAMTQVLIVLMLSLSGFMLCKLPAISREGEATIKYDADGEVFEVTEKDNYAYAQIHHSIAWVVAAPVLWMEKQNWSPQVALVHALMVMIAFIAALASITAMLIFRKVFKDLEEQSTPAAKKELTDLKARLPFNGRSMLYVVILVSLSGCSNKGLGLPVAGLIIMVVETIWLLFGWVKKPKTKRRESQKMETDDLANLAGVDEATRRYIAAVDARVRQMQQLDQPDDQPRQTAREAALARLERGPIYPGHQR